MPTPLLPRLLPDPVPALHPLAEYRVDGERAAAYAAMKRGAVQAVGRHPRVDGQARDDAAGVAVHHADVVTAGAQAQQPGQAAQRIEVGAEAACSLVQARDDAVGALHHGVVDEVRIGAAAS